MSIETIIAFLDFLQPCSAKEIWLGFYGGEPLLAWPLIEKTVAHARKNRKNKFHFTLTTNGSLLKKEHILFLKENQFELVLSYDGLAQKSRDLGSITAVEATLQNLQKLYPKGYVVNSVFTPTTISMLTASISALIKQGQRRLQYALDLSVPWEDSALQILESELGRLAECCQESRRETGMMPVENFRDAGGKGIFACFAGRDRLALLPDDTVWGCYMFYDLLGYDPRHPDYAKYCFGKLPAFMRGRTRAKAVAAKYRDLRQDYFFTEKKELCSLCARLESCSVCPVVAALASTQLGVIPAWTCRVKALQARFKVRLAAVL